MKNLNAILIGMLLMSTLACNKDTINEAQKVKVTFTGQIIDQNGIPVYGASVRVGNQFIETGFDGNFNFNPVERQSNNAIIRVAAEGYYTFSRAYYVENNAVKPVTIQLIKRVQVGTFDNASGGTVNIPGGPILKFPANSTNSTGNINVFAHYLSPADENLGLKMPGDLRDLRHGGSGVGKQPG
jgi:uncharacterized membrane protein